MFKPELLTLVINEEPNLWGDGVRKISASELSELFRVLSVSYTIATHLESNALFSNSDNELNIRDCLSEILLLDSSAGTDVHAQTFNQNIDVFYQRYFNQNNLFNQLEISSISYNSPMKVVISGRSFKALILTVTILGGEVTMGDFSVKMPGISDAVERLSKTYIEIQKHHDNKELVERVLDNHMMTLPHQDIHQISALDNKI